VSVTARDSCSGPAARARAPGPRRGVLRRLVVTAVVGLTLGSAACNDVIENPVRPIVVTTPIVVSINIISTQIDSVTLQLQAFAQFTDGAVQEVTADAGWGSSNNAVATVTPTGLAMAVGNGSATITATYDGITGAFPLNVAGL